MACAVWGNSKCKLIKLNTKIPERGKKRLSFCSESESGKSYNFSFRCKQILVNNILISRKSSNRIRWKQRDTSQVPFVLV